MSNIKLETGNIMGPCGRIEAEAVSGNAQGAYSHTNSLAIICHPHPQHGGAMGNKVVTTLARTYRDLGVGVVRFNFRGVGASAGDFDHAVGEVDDLLAVVQWLASCNATANILLAGFSFGASIAAQGCYRTQNVKHLALIAPPVTRYNFDLEHQFPVPVCIVQGAEDERVVEADVALWAKTLTSPVEYYSMASAGHFFHGCLPALKTCIETSLANQYPVVGAEH